MSEWYPTNLRFVHKYLCCGLYNPIFWSAVAVMAEVFVHLPQLHHLMVYGDYEFVFPSDYMVDIAQTLVSMLFVVRFSMGVFFNPIVETVLLLLQNLGCAFVLFHHQYSLIYSPVSIVIKVFVVCQIACPYFIIILNLISSWHHGEDEKETMNYREFVIDTNNNFLPIFMGHSFLCINSSFPFALGLLALMVYKVAQLAIKFYCIHVFCLFEMVLFRHNVIEDGLATDYAEYYTPVVLGEMKKPPEPSISLHNKVLLVALSTTIAFDTVFVIIGL